MKDAQRQTCPSFDSLNLTFGKPAKATSRTKRRAVWQQAGSGGGKGLEKKCQGTQKISQPFGAETLEASTSVVVFLMQSWNLLASHFYQAVEKMGWTPFHLAAVNGDTDLIECLKEDRKCFPMNICSVHSRQHLPSACKRTW